MAAPSDPTPPPAGDDALLESLVAACLSDWPRAGPGALDELCAQHPADATRLRARIAKLRALGVVTLADAPAAAASDDAAPERIGPYEILGLLGRGGMGEVWRARQREPVERTVALKVIKRGMDTDRIVRRFASERRALASLRHDGIAVVFDAGTTASGRPWFAMELVDGEPITDFCDRHRLRTEARLALFARVCDAVHHAHQNGIIHRDLKPSNILVREVDGAPQPKIIDFGLAKAMTESAEERSLLTEVGHIVGTPEYMSPEQAEPGGDEVDTRTDVFSLGVVLFELLTGELPRAASAVRDRPLAEQLRALRDAEVARPSSRLALREGADGEVALRRGCANVAALRRRIRGDLDWITLRALDRERERRYAAVSELAADVRRHLAHEPVQAGPPSAAYRVAKFARRHRAAVAATAAVVATLVIALFLVLRENRRAQRYLADVDSLADAGLLERYEQQAREDLWPARPETAPAMDAWLERARALAARLPRHERTLAERGAAMVATGSDAGAPRYSEHLLVAQLEKLVHGLRAFTAPGGTIAQIEGRRDDARTLRARSIDAHRDAWERAIAEIADPSRCPAYRGLRIAPQIGLVPLGADPDSGLHEFALLTPGGGVPQRGDDGVLAFEADSELVLVLLPGGTARIGAEREPTSARYDPRAEPYEGPVRTVTLAPFFVAKFEVSQGQWLRWFGENPSMFAFGSAMGRSIAPTNPVERVSWRVAEQRLRRLGLALPTEAQWEYAARGGTDTPWWTGDDVASLYELHGGRGGANLADRSCQQHAMAKLEVYDDFDDGYIFHAPVDACRGNGFGLHHVLGNVWEWCRDFAPDYATTVPRPGDGYREAPDQGRRSWRGGSYYSSAARARCAFRLQGTVDDAPGVVGIRPVRVVDVD